MSSVKFLNNSEKEKKKSNPKLEYKLKKIHSIIYIYIYIVRNSPSMNENFTLDKKDKVKHYIKIKTHNNIVSRF